MFLNVRIEVFPVQPRLVLVGTIQFVATLHFVAQELRAEENGAFDVSDTTLYINKTICKNFLINDPR